MELDTLVSLVVLVTTIVGSHAVLRRELKSDIMDVRDTMTSDLRRLDGRIDRLEGRIDRLDDRIDRLDDRMYQLAAGLKPLVEQAERQA